VKGSSGQESRSPGQRFEAKKCEPLNHDIRVSNNKSVCRSGLPKVTKFGNGSKAASQSVTESVSRRFAE
jgi:hypothetical protein